MVDPTAEDSDRQAAQDAAATEALVPGAPATRSSDSSDEAARAVLRDIAELGLLPAADDSGTTPAAEQAKGEVEEPDAIADVSFTDYSQRAVELVHQNASAAFRFAENLLAATTFAEVVELSTAHALGQFAALSAQSKELAVLARSATSGAIRPTAVTTQRGHSAG
jgi:hypothetical protein